MNVLIKLARFSRCVLFFVITTDTHQTDRISAAGSAQATAKWRWTKRHSASPAGGSHSDAQHAASRAQLLRASSSSHESAITHALPRWHATPERPDLPAFQRHAATRSPGPWRACTSGPGRTPSQHPRAAAERAEPGHEWSAATAPDAQPVWDAAAWTPDAADAPTGHARWAAAWGADAASEHARRFQPAVVVLGESRLDYMLACMLTAVVYSRPL